MERLLNYNQLAEILGVTEGTLRLWVQAKYIPYIKLGLGRNGSVRFAMSDVKDWLNTRKTKGKKELINLRG